MNPAKQSPIATCESLLGNVVDVIGDARRAAARVVNAAKSDRSHPTHTVTPDKEIKERIYRSSEAAVPSRRGQNELPAEPRPDHGMAATMRAKRPVRGGLKVRAYPVLYRAIEDGVAYGWRRAHKHIDAPDVQTIEDQIVTDVVNEICQYFDFEDTETQ